MAMMAAARVRAGYRGPALSVDAWVHALEFLGLEDLAHVFATAKGVGLRGHEALQALQKIKHVDLRDLFVPYPDPWSGDRVGMALTFLLAVFRRMGERGAASVDATANPGITNERLVMMAPFLADDARVDLTGCSQVTNDGVILFRLQKPGVRLGVDWCWQVVDDTCKACPVDVAMHSLMAIEHVRRSPKQARRVLRVCGECPSDAGVEMAFMHAELAGGDALFDSSVSLGWMPWMERMFYGTGDLFVLSYFDAVTSGAGMPTTTPAPPGCACASAPAARATCPSTPPAASTARRCRGRGSTCAAAGAAARGACWRCTPCRGATSTWSDTT